MPHRLHSPSATPAATRLRVDAYATLDYRRHYADLLARHPNPRQAIAELGLFRFWLACRSQHPGSPGDSTTLLAPAPPLREWPLPLQLDDCDVQDELDADITHLIESRFDLYDRFFNLGRHADDPLGLDAASLALACQLFAQPSPELLQRLRRESRQLFEQWLAPSNGVA
jgi:hypothetical protein